MQRIVFVTGNKHKVEEAELALGKKLSTVDLDALEIQDEDVAKVSEWTVKWAFSKMLRPCFVEDTGLYIAALNGFPGAYAKYAKNTIGYDGWLRLLEGKADRSAEARTAIAFHDGRAVHVFVGSVRGSIAAEKRGVHGWGFDPIFIPEGSSKTYGEDIEFRLSDGHRARAFKKFRAYLEESGLYDAL
jgi:XTP/dITP diphosphohydrolase